MHMSHVFSHEGPEEAPFFKVNFSLFLLTFQPLPLPYKESTTHEEPYPSPSHLRPQLQAKRKRSPPISSHLFSALNL